MVAFLLFELSPAQMVGAQVSKQGLKVQGLGVINIQVDTAP